MRFLRRRVRPRAVVRHRRRRRTAQVWRVILTDRDHLYPGQRTGYEPELGVVLIGGEAYLLDGPHIDRLITSADYRLLPAEQAPANYTTAVAALLTGTPPWCAELRYLRTVQPFDRETGTS